MKKLVSLLLLCALLCSLCSFASADEPLHIEFWHTRGSGANYEVCKASVEEFNATIGAQNGIVVEEIYQGNYNANVTKMQLASQAGGLPAVGVTSSAHTAMLLDDGLAADMAPYMAETGFDVNKFFDSLLDVPAIHDGQVRTLPYVRSAPVFYYNKTMADAKGLKAPVTVADMEAFCKALHVPGENGEVTTWGFELLEDTSYLQGAFLWSTGYPLIGENRTAPCLENESLLRLFTDWRRWVDEGWCRPYDSTNASATVQEMFYQGKMASFVASCGSLGNIDKHAKESGFELGVSYFPAYESQAVGIGGGNLILLEGNSDEVKRAGWLFIEFLMSDDQIATNAIQTGYLPTTKTMETNEKMQAFWAENPLFKVAYDELAWGHCNETPYFPERMEFMNNIAAVTSMLIQEGNITAQQAFDQVKMDNAHLFE